MNDTSNKLNGTIALVTGANRGLGKALVRALLASGASKVYAAARDERQVDFDGRVEPLRLDVTKPEEIAAAAQRAVDVTLLINNAGRLSSFNVLAASSAELNADFGIQVHGTLNVIKAFVPVLGRAANGATIVNVLSLSSLASVPSMGGYSASKAAAYSITQALRPELAKKSIRVLAALPGPIDTEMVKDLALPKTSASEVAERIVAGIVSGDEEIFPDAMAQQMGALWLRDPKAYERAFASF
jgi:NAD(P)-dependent dehydrogenase (short-subunit alcohol dehydrogenase family)